MMETELQSPKQQLIGATAILIAAFFLAGAYAVVTRATFDYDEFVVLMLGKAIAHGGTPYRDFTFFHPPGIIIVLALFDPLIQHSWLWGRVPSLVLDAATCSLVYLIAIHLYRRQSVAIAAGLLCASSPVMLITGTRIFQDDYVGFFGLLAIYLLLISPSKRVAVLAGACLGIAFLFKYPAVLIGPACLVLAGRRRSPYLVGAAVLTVGLLVIPLLPELPKFISDTIGFQTGRASQPLTTKFLGVTLFLILLQPLGFFGLFTKPRHPWLIVAYLSAFLYLLTPQVYYHYMEVFVPFASLLGAAYLGSLPKLNPRALVPAVAAGSVAVTALWAGMVYWGGTYGGQSPLHMTVALLSSEQQMISYVKTIVPPSGSVLDDRPEVVFVAKRNNLDNYFWNVSDIENYTDLLPGTLKIRYIVHSYGSSSGFPNGFLDFLARKSFCTHQVGDTKYGGSVYDLNCSNTPLPSRS
jgi:Dolichyl-phosphate-mannose-protein mannosyltransferase